MVHSAFASTSLTKHPTERQPAFHYTFAAHGVVHALVRSSPQTNNVLHSTIIVYSYYLATHSITLLHSQQVQTSTFQAVLITDGAVSFALFIYECDKLSWDGAVIGWAETGSNQYESNYYSGDSSRSVGCQLEPKTTLIYRLSEYEGGHHRLSEYEGENYF